MILRSIKRIDSVYLLIAIMFVVLPFLATLQFNWLEKMAKNQLDRAVFVYQSDAEEAAAAAGQEIEQIYHAVKFCSIPRTFDDAEILFTDVHERLLKKYDSNLSDIISDSYWLRFSAGSQPQIKQYGSDEKDLKTVPAGELAALIDYLSEFTVAPFFGNEQLPIGVFGNVMALVVNMVDPSSAQSEFGCVVMVIDRDYFAEQIVRPLGHEFFCKTETADLSFAVVDSVSQSLVFSTNSGLSWEDYGATEISAPMFRIQQQLVLVNNDEAPADNPQRARVAPPRVVHPNVGPPGHFSLLVRHPDGSLAAHVSSLHRRNILLGSVVFLVLAVSFILLAIMARRALRLTRLQQEFIGGVSHELRTPLAVISAAGENLADDVVQDPASVRKYGKLIQKEGRRLHNMVEGVLQFTRMQATYEINNAAIVDLADLIAEILDQFSHQLTEATFEVESDLPDELPPVYGDRTALGIAIGNLLSNAIKYGKEKPWLGMSAAADQNNVVVTIRDMGPGVDPRERKKIFQPFYRTEATKDAQIPGSGLGLSIVAGIVSRHDGRLEQENLPGGGCRFSIILPIAKSGHGVKS